MSAEPQSHPASGRKRSPVPRRSRTKSRRTTPDERTAFFDHLAREHDAMAFQPEDAPRLARLRERLGDLSGWRLLEPGCGAGHLTERLARWVGPAGKVVAVEPSPTMLARARRRVGAKRNVSWTESTIETAVFPAMAFGGIVCFRVWPHFDDNEAVLARFARWLKPGGRLWIAHWQGRGGLAAIHGADPAVAGDLFPARRALKRALARNGFAVATWIDDEREIFIAAER